MRKHRVTGLAPALALAIAAHAVLAGQQQPPAQPVVASGAISGVVVDSVTQKPIAGAVVQLSGAPVNVTTNQNVPPPGTVAITTDANGNRTTIAAPPEPFRGQRLLTDEQGRFVFTNLPGNMSFALTAARYGYFDAAHGRPGVPGAAGNARRIVLADGQWFRDARIEMVRPSAINGRVTDETGDPVVGVVVKSYAEVFVGGSRQVAAGPAVPTDDRGIYRIANLTPGRFVIAVPSVQHAVPAAMTTAELAGQTPQAAAAAGPPSRRNPSFSSSDGEYRTILGENAPSPATAANGAPQVYPTTFHPSTRSLAEATSVQLRPGDDRQAIDIQLTPSQVFKISGRIDGPSDAFSGLSLRLMGAGLESLGRGSETATALVSGDGSFTFLNVPNGAYTIIGNRSIIEYQYSPSATTTVADTGNAPGVHFISMSMTNADPGAVSSLMLARSTAQGNVKYQARQAVSVSGRDVANLLVPVQAGVTLRGTIVVEASGPQVPTLMTSVRAEAANGDPSLGQPNFSRSRQASAGDEEFVLEGLLPGAYVVRGPANIKSITWNGRDYLDAPFDTTSGRDITGVVITLTDKVTTLSGAVRDRAGQPAANTAVIVFPADRARWSNYGLQPARIKSSAGSTSGNYSIRGLPAGDYLIVAVDDNLAGRWKEPAFLEAAARTATRLTLNWGDAQKLDLVLQEIK